MINEGLIFHQLRRLFTAQRGQTDGRRSSVYTPPFLLSQLNDSFYLS